MKGKKKGARQGTLAFSDVTDWEVPDISLIQSVPKAVINRKPNETLLRKNAELLQSVLADFNIHGAISSIHPGPVVTLYELEPAPGTKTSRVISLSDDIARSMSAISVRCAVVPGRNVIGIELPNKERQTVYMREMLESRLYEKTSAKLPLILGKDISGQPILADLAKMPHLLVAGTTGSGKSVAVNTMVLSLLYRLTPQQCRLIMIDPKMLELSVYDDIPHLLSPVVTEPGRAIVALKWAVREMEQRYRNMSKLGVRNIEGYNSRIREALKKGETIVQKVQTGFDPETGEPEFEDHEMDLVELPYIVVVVDEFADLMLVAGKDVENAIQRLAQMARAAGIHLIMATQRPSVDVITGVIKANFPTRISFQVTSKIDSRTILGDSGAEQLLGLGDMLYMAPGGRVTRVHGPFVSDEDVEKTAAFLRSQAVPDYIDNLTEDGDFGDSEIMAAMFGDGGSGGSSNSVDELYDKAVAVVAREGKVSTSFIQRHLQIGYNRAARIVEEMERQGIISPANATGKREILIRDFSDV
ncbi:MAG: DNA translocase FtsK [Alphaproteobacteria bacterium]|nr:DNA translocase FtsK [Alphaproteobacteria bacterium]